MDKTTQLETIKAYRIRDWHKHFENNRTRDMVKMAWVPVPNKHDGEGFQRIMREKDGMVIYGCWHLILQVASKCLRERGTLLREDGTPLDADAIAYKTGWRSAGDIQRSLDFLCTPQIGWIEQVAQDGQIIPHLPAAIPHLPAVNGMEGNGIEGNHSASDKPTSEEVIFWDSSSGFTGISEQDMNEWAIAYPACDLQAEIQRASQWLKANPKKKKKLFRKFLTGWLNRSQEKGGSIGYGKPAKSDGLDMYLPDSRPLNEQELEWSRLYGPKEKAAT